MAAARLQRLLRRASFNWCVLGGVALLNLLIGAMLAVFLQQSYRQHQDHAAVTARNLATALKENISATVKEIDVALAMAAEDAGLHLDDAAELTQLLARARQSTPALAALRIVDAEGRLLHGPALAAPAGKTAALADADYFRAVRAHAGAGLAVGKPEFDAAAQRWHIPFARALRRPGAPAFRGALLAEVDQRRLAHAFSLVSVGPKGAMTLTSSDEVVFARYAHRRIDDSMTGATITSVTLRAYVASGRQPDTYLFRSRLDDTERLISLQRIFDQPLLIAPRELYFSVGLATDDYLAKWREERNIGLAIMFISVALSGAAAWLLLRFWAERTANQERLRGFEREHAVNEERLRIMQDLHDGVGSQLLSALMMVQSGNATQAETVALLQECMDDMRLAIDSLSPDEPDLLPVLGNFRYRMEQRFRGVGVALHWRNHDMPDAVLIAPHDGLQVLRILQEALANVLRHAQAKSATVDLYFSPLRLRARIADDGIGYVAADKPHSRGLVNMRLRARKLGATFAIGRLAAGTEVELELPLAAPPARAAASG